MTWKPISPDKMMELIAHSEAEMEQERCGHLDDWGYEQDELERAMIKLFRSRNLQ